MAGCLARDMLAGQPLDVAKLQVSKQVQCYQIWIEDAQGTPVERLQLGAITEAQALWAARSLVTIERGVELWAGRRLVTWLPCTGRR